MVCRWLRIGPLFTTVAVVVAVIVTPDAGALLCAPITICHVCI